LILTEDQLTAIYRAQTPLHPMQRIAFRQALDAWLADRQAVGDGELFRCLRDLQRQVYAYPQQIRHRS
jgi:hypothetical protein